MTETIAPPVKRHRPDVIPPLRNGDHLTREEFHRRYEAMGEGTRAELIEGVVYLQGNGMPSPVSLNKHSKPHGDLYVWLAQYCMRTPSLMRGVDGTIFADNENEPQPDVLLGIPESAGGQTRTVVRGTKDYVANAPELVGEVAASTASIDLNAKLHAYQRNNVREYVVVLTEEETPQVRYHVLTNGRFELLEPEDGLFKSRVFPGLWLDGKALLAGDLPKLAAAVEAGCATAEHAAFVEQLRSGDSGRA
ncbi:MAG: Uma2 family endonuclease [Planctomycetota bacterium]